MSLRKRPAKKPRYSGDPAMQTLVDALVDIWVKHWGRLPGVSQDPVSGEIGGPFVRFVEEYRRILVEQLTLEDIEMDPGVKKVLEKTSAQALRERIQKSPYHALRGGAK